VPAIFDRGICMWWSEEQHVGQRTDTQDPDCNEYQKHARLSLVQSTAADAVVRDAAFVHVWLR